MSQLEQAVGERSGEAVETLSAQGMVRSYRFAAWLPEEVLVPKVAGFVVGAKASLLAAAPEEIRLRLGRRPLFGWLAERNPSLDITLKLFRPRNAQRAMTFVTAELRPRGRGVSRQMARRWCDDVAERLRAHFIV